MRHICNFSCGAASAVATKITLAEQVDVLIINAFIVEEHEDNRRFAADCEQWFGQPITILRNDDYGASTLEVWRRKRFIKGEGGAPCSRALKRDILSGWTFPLLGEVTVIGYTTEEQGRADELEANFPQESFSFPLIAHGLGKSDCLAIVARAGIELPLMYRNAGQRFAAGRKGDSLMENSELAGLREEVARLRTPIVERYLAMEQQLERARKQLASLAAWASQQICSCGAGQTAAIIAGQVLATLSDSGPALPAGSAPQAKPDRG